MPLKCMLLLISLNIKIISTKDELKNVKSYINMFHKSPKVWHQYIPEFLDLTLQQTELFRSGPVGLMQDLVYFSEYLTKKMLVVPKLKKTLKYSLIHEVVSGRHTGLVKHSTGGFGYITNRHILPAAYLWVFRLDEELRMNLTFTQMFLSSGSLDCTSGNITIEQRYTSGHRKRHTRLQRPTVGHKHPVGRRQRVGQRPTVGRRPPAGQIHRVRPMLTYCGQHSQFNAFPGIVKFRLRLAVGKMVLYKFNGIFSVMDTSMVSNRNLKRKLFFFHPYAVHAFRNEHILFSYHLRTQKNYKIQLHLSDVHEKMFIYDGPGIQFQQLELYINIMVSTFQCVVQISTNNGQILKFNNIKFYSKQLEVNRQITFYNSGDINEIFLPDLICLASPCVIHVQSESGTQINVTISQMKYQGELYLECDDAGLVAMEELDDENKESATICSDYNTNTQSRNFYSQNSSLRLILYWYKPHSFIEVTLNISQTPCGIAWLDDCKMSSICLPFAENLDTCNAYLGSVSKFSKAKLIYEMNLNDNVHFTVPDGECLVIQVYHGNSYSIIQDFGDTCVVPLVPRNMFVSPGRITYTMLGSLHNYAATIVCKDELDFLNTADEFCFTHIDLEEIRCEKNIKFPTLQPNQNHCYDNHVKFGSGLGSECSNFTLDLGSGFESTGFGLESDDFIDSIGHSLFYEKQDIYVYAITKTPIHTNSLEVYTKFYLHTKSWVDITISYTTDNHQENQYVSEFIPLFLREYELENVRTSPANILHLEIINTSPQKEQNIPNMLIHCYFVISDEGRMSTWNTLMKVVGNISHKVISVLGSLIQMSFKFRHLVRRKLLSNYALKLTWIHDNYAKYISFSEMEPIYCGQKPLYSFNHTVNCFEFYPPLTVDVWFSKITQYQVFNGVESDLLSWNQACSLCKEAGYSLPYFTSRESLDDLLAVFKMSQYFHQLEGFYIGLYIKGKSQVSTE